MTDRTVVRVYADTSVYGGVFDDEFERPSKVFFERAGKGEIRLVTSALVAGELTPAPEQVRGYYETASRLAEHVRIFEACLQLRDAYVEAGIVNPSSAADALHVALATVHGCPVLVSWNCRHIVHFQKIPKYNAVNRLHDFGDLSIHTPLEIIGDEDDHEEEV